MPAGRLTGKVRTLTEELVEKKKTLSAEAEEHKAKRNELNAQASQFAKERNELNMAPDALGNINLKYVDVK